MGGAMVEADWTRPWATLEGTWRSISPPGVFIEDETVEFSLSERPDGEGLSQRFYSSRVTERDEEGWPAKQLIVSGLYTLNRSVCPHELDVRANLIEYTWPVEDWDWSGEYTLLLEDVEFKGLLRVDVAERRMDLVIGDPNGERPCTLIGASKLYAVDYDNFVFLSDW